MNQGCQGIVKLRKPASQIVDANSVTEILTEYSRLWRQIGLKLGLNSTVLENFKRDGTDQRDRFEKTLNAWQRLAGSNATWGALELAITNANREDLGLKSLPKLPTVPNDAHIQQGSSGQIDVLLEPSPGELLIKCITKTNKAPISTD
ncbi:uncharacterized protein [Dysidea avara]|uniref:uncharacterized protein n=1 Tax=Dysidea avara TaxID=196820 RepID=UPI0033341134